MSGKIVYRPGKTHMCDPPKKPFTVELAFTDLIEVPVGTIWHCDECGATWRCVSGFRGRKRWEPETWWERFMREIRGIHKLRR
jgi:hypothetical protein